MTYRRAMAGVFMLLMLGACSGVSVSSDYTPETDFKAFKSYQWYSAKLRDPQSLEFLGGDIFDKRVRQSIDEALQAKGFRLQTEGEVDFRVNYDVLTKDRQEIRTYNTYGGYGPGWGHYGRYGYGGMGSTTTQVVDYKQGQLIIDIVEPEQNLLVWRGTADGRISKTATAEKRAKSIRDIVNRILANFPPQTGKK